MTKTATARKWFLPVINGRRFSSPEISVDAYNTVFPLTENPISESGRWDQGGATTGIDWGDVRTNGTIAYGTRNNVDNYGDSIALISGFTPNVRITAVVSYTGARSGGTLSHEVELILRGNYTANNQLLYECNYGYDGSTGTYMQIVKQTGAIGQFDTGLATVINTPPAQPTNGDVFQVTIIGNVINSYLNGTLMTTATDPSPYTSGRPGIGFFWRGSENQTDLAFSSVTFEAL